VRNYFDNFIEVLKHLAKEYESICMKVEDYGKIKIECEKFKFDFEEYKKNYHNEIQNIKKEFNEKLNLEQNNKIVEIIKIEEGNKSRMDKLRGIIIEKENGLNILIQDYELIKSQLLITENNLETIKKLQREQEYF